MKNTKTKKNSAAKKLIPATSMLLVSATMLATSTYAWFTMSREVEVTGIKMTAVVPEDLQISLGDENIGNTKLLSANTNDDGTTAGETAYTDGSQVFAGTIKAPTVSTNTNDWHNSVAFSKYYQAARLMPASSTDGNYLFKTADATSQGETVSKTAAFDLVTVASTSAKNDMAGLYVNGDPDSGTLDDRANAGYYVDFPVWFRTSSQKASVTGLTDNVATPANATTLQLGVKATITQNTGIEAKEDLYHAVRVAVLPTSGNWDTTTTVAATDGSYTGVIHDGVLKDSKKYYDRYTGTGTANSTLSSEIVRQAVKTNGYLHYNPTSGLQTNVDAIYASADVVTQASTLSDGFYTNGEVVVSVPLATNQNEYGTPVKYIIRVWLEGEDEYCWNPNAGQDWNISLQFVKLDATAANHEAPADNATGQGTASLITGGGAASGATGSAAAVNNTSIAVTATSCGADAKTLSGTYTYDASAGTVTESGTAIADFLDDTHKVTDVVTPAGNGGSPAAVYGTGNQTYTLADGTRIGNSADLKAYILRYGKEYDLSTIALGTGVAN